MKLSPPFIRLPLHIPEMHASHTSFFLKGPLKKAEVTVCICLGLKALIEWEDGPCRCSMCTRWW